MSQYSRRVFAVAFRVLRMKPDAQEVTQDVFFAVWRSPERFDAARGPLLTWLVILSRSRALDLLRRMHNPLQDIRQAKALHSIPAQAASRDREIMVEELLGRLPHEQRWLMRKVYFEGLTFPEIAALRSKPLGTVKNRARFALKKLRAELEDNCFH
jgi:RNA polymerase sigma-70 factor (ECF subfamily)